MPKNELPDAARVLPKAGQKVWMTAFNEALDRGLPEDEASAMAWAAVKRAGYSKDSGGKWSKSMDFNNELTINEDGTFEFSAPLMKVNVKKREVSGFATLDNVDQAGDRVGADASLDAFGAWFGNIREMHEKKAVGKAIDWRPDVYTDEETGNTYNGIWVTAKISKGAEDTWQKVLDGTLAGFSIGGATQAKERAFVKDAEGNSRQIWDITKYRLTELSLVDNPCNKLATISLVKSVDGVPEVDATVEDGEIEKAYNGETGEFVNLEGEYKNVISALEALRDRAIREKADHVVAEASYQLASYRSNARWECKEAEYANNSVSKADDLKENDMTEELNKSENGTEGLQENETSDTNVVELTEEDKGLFRKFVEFIKGETPTESGAESEITKEETPEMNEEEVTKAITEAGEELTKGVDEKFGQVGESLDKIAGLLEKVATTEVVDELKKEFADQLEALAARVEVVEKSGAIQKSGDDAGETAEKIEKSDEGFWGDSILPEFLKNR